MKSRSAIFVLAVVTLYLSAGNLHAQVGKEKAGERVAELVKLLDKGDDAQRWNALMKLADHGPDAAPALPQLLALLQSDKEELRLASCLVLGSIGKDAIAPLLKLLDHEDASVRYYACWALGGNGPIAKDAIPGLLGQLRRPANAAVFRRAAMALGQIGQEPDRVIPALIEALDEIGDHRENGVVDAIVQFGPAAVPYLEKPLGRAERSVSLYASIIAGRIGEPAKNLLPSLEKLLAESHAGDEALKAMVKIGRSSAPYLKKHLNRGSTDWQMRIVDSLAALGAWEEVADAVEAKAVEVRRLAVRHLDTAGSQPVVLAGLIEACKDADALTAIPAQVALARRGTQARKAIPVLVEVLFGPAALERARTFETFRALDHDPRPDMRAALKSNDGRRRALAGYWLLTRLEEKGDDVVAAMRDGLDKLNAYEQREIAKLLASRRVKGKAVSVLAGFLKTEKDSEERFRILQALCPLAEDDDDAIRAIALALRDPHAVVRSDAARFLGGLAPRSRIELPALRRALDDPEAAVRDRAREAIDLIEKQK